MAVFVAVGAGQIAARMMWARMGWENAIKPYKRGERLAAFAASNGDFRPPRSGTGLLGRPGFPSVPHVGGRRNGVNDVFIEVSPQLGVMRRAVCGVVLGDAGIGAAAEKYPRLEQAVALQREDVRQLSVKLRSFLKIDRRGRRVQSGNFLLECAAVLRLVRVLLGENRLPPGRARYRIAEPGGAASALFVIEILDIDRQVPRIVTHLRPVDLGRGQRAVVP